ncbi:MAG: GNAT family N-acetyltransferase [Desulfobacteraceae bacterium 4572_19]|nr:MAG: GNAT family N-acetyltransferase [Desulfobacteraceae bacterium 4572_19]
MSENWKDLIVSHENVLKKIKPGMSIFLGSGVAEPRTLVRHILDSDASNLRDLEIIQLISFGDVITVKEIVNQKFRLKTFFSGWITSDAVTEGRVDLIPSRFWRIPDMFQSGQIPIDAAFIQVTPPNEAGYCSLGVSIDVARQAMEQASLIVGEINDKTPRTFGDTLVPVSDFNMLVQSNDEIMSFDRLPFDNILSKIAKNTATLIEDGSCLSFSIGPLFDALSQQLESKRNLGIHSLYFTDALMDLIKSGAVTNRNKAIGRGTSLASYAFGTKDLLSWLDCNPLVEFSGVRKVFDPVQIGQNSNFKALIPVRRVDLAGRLVLQKGKQNVGIGPGQLVDLFSGADISEGGRVILMLPSRNRSGTPTIKVSIVEYEDRFPLRDVTDMVVTEYGVAYLRGRTVRERAQALIEIAHPDDREKLIKEAKDANILYKDQLFIAESAHLYPSDVGTIQTFKKNLTLRFRAILPSDEEKMRRLFYRFSDETVYYRYFTTVKVMPHYKMQEYVNVDYGNTMSIVVLKGEIGKGIIVGEARYIKNPANQYADVAFVVDEDLQGVGLGTYLFQMLIRIAKERGVLGFTADVLSSNRGMMKVFEKGGIPVKAKLEDGAYVLTMPFY